MAHNTIIRNELALHLGADFMQKIDEEIAIIKNNIGVCKDFSSNNKINPVRYPYDAKVYENSVSKDALNFLYETICSLSFQKNNIKVKRTLIENEGEHVMCMKQFTDLMYGGQFHETIIVALVDSIHFMYVLEDATKSNDNLNYSEVDADLEFNTLISDGMREHLILKMLHKTVFEKPLHLCSGKDEDIFYCIMLFMAIKYAYISWNFKDESNGNQVQSDKCGFVNFYKNFHLETFVSLTCKQNDDFDIMYSAISEYEFVIIPGYTIKFKRLVRLFASFINGIKIKHLQAQHKVKYDVDVIKDLMRSNTY